MFTAPLGLTPGQEVAPPERISDGTGTGSATYDEAAMILSVMITWENLTAPAVASHIHCCSGPGANSTVAVDFAGLPSVASGSYSSSIDLTLAGSFGSGFLNSFMGDVTAARNAVIAGLSGGQAYFNIHTSTYPAGEIRGDIVGAAAIPEPATMSLIGLGLGVLALRKRFA
jgi:hypothetical protein